MNFYQIFIKSQNPRMKIFFECIAFILGVFSAEKFLFHRLIIQMAHFWKTQAKCIKEVRDIILITFSQNQMIENHETYISIFLLIITNLLLRKYFILAYDDGSDFDASELVDDSEDQSDDDSSNLSSKDL